MVSNRKIKEKIYVLIDIIGEVVISDNRLIFPKEEHVTHHAMQFTEHSYYTNG